MSAYADTSFLVSLYTMDANSRRASELMLKAIDALPYTTFHRLELRNAIRLRAARIEIDWPTAHAAIRQIDEDLRDGILLHTPASWTEICRTADELSERFPGCRTLDLIHVATAATLGFTDFFTFDVRQAQLARKTALKIRP